jgi:hypothetical protein
MMRFVLATIWFVIWSATGWAQSSSSPDYVLTLDGVEHELSLDQDSTIKLKSGAEIPVKLSRREFSRFKTGELSFEYSGKYSVASTQVDDNTTQHIVVTALGTIMLVQNYQDTLPGELLDIMFDKMVEEPKALGLAIEKTELNRAVANSGVLTGVRGHYKGGDDDVTIDITVAQSGSGGFLVLTMHDAFTAPEEKQVIERFWQSLTLEN